MRVSGCFQLPTLFTLALLSALLAAYAVFSGASIAASLLADEPEWRQGATPAMVAPDTSVPPAVGRKAYLPLVAGPLPARLLIAAAYIDSAVSGEADEAVLLWNAGYSSQTLAGWQLVANGRRATFPRDLDA